MSRKTSSNHTKRKGGWKMSVVKCADVPKQHGWFHIVRSVFLIFVHDMEIYLSEIKL